MPKINKENKQNTDLQAEHLHQVRGVDSGQDRNLGVVNSTKWGCQKYHGKFPMDMRIPTFRIEIILESNPPKSIMLVGRLAIQILRSGQNRYGHVRT